MRWRRAAKWTLVLLVLAAVSVGAVIYALAAAVPAGYAPARLDAEQRRHVAGAFYSHVLAFGNDAQQSEPYTWTLTEREANEYLASVDEINARRPDGKAGQVDEIFAAAGLSDPAVAFGEGRLTLLGRAREHNKVVTVDLHLAITPEKRLAVRLAGVRVGRLPVPEPLVREHVAKLKDLASRAAHGAGDATPAARVGEVLAAVIAAIDDEPIMPELTWPVNDKRVRIDDIRIDDDRLTLEVVPVGRRPA